MKRESDIAMFEDVQIYEQELPNGGTLAILRGGLKNENPVVYMDCVVSDYVKGKLYNEFIEEYLDNPWVRVIITGINELPYYDYEKRKK